MNDAFYESLAVWSQIGGSIAFIIALVYLFNRFVVPAVAASQQRKNAELAEAERRRDAAGETVAAAQRELERSGGDARGIEQRGATDAVRERERIVTEATAEGERVVRNAEGELGRARIAAHDRLRTELIEQALQIARAAAGNVDATTNAKLVGGVMDQLERSGGSP